jgi:hypothetical protein
MRHIRIRVLVVANILALGLVVWNLVPRGYADSGLSTEDLVYGLIDADGDGRYTDGDDWFVSYALENFPEHVETALKSARRNADGGVDLSGHLQAVSAQAFQRAIDEAAQRARD